MNSIPQLTNHPQNLRTITQHRSVGATGDIVYQQPQTQIYSNLMNNESPPHSGQNQLYNPIGQNLINSAKPIMPTKMSAWDRKQSEDAGSLLAGGDSLQQRSRTKHNTSHNNNNSKRKKSIKFPPNLLHPQHNRFLSQNIIKNTFRNQGIYTQNLITRDYSPNATMPQVINTSVKGVSIERSTLGNQLTILKLKQQVQMLKEETHQLTQLNFKLCDENEMLQEENQSLGGTGAVEKNQLLSTNIQQGSMPGAPHKFDSPNARIKYFEKRNAHNKASLKVKSIMNQTVLQAERREYKENIKEIMEKSQQQIEDLRQTLCKQNDDTLEMLAESTRKLVQLEQEKHILMANLGFVKEEFQKFASMQVKKPIKKPTILSQNKLSPVGKTQNVQQQDDEDQDQDPEQIIEQYRGKIKQLQLDKEDLQQEAKEKDRQIQEKNKTILDYQNKYNEIDIDFLHQQINQLKAQNEILQKQKKILQNPSKEQQQEEQGEQEQDVNPEEEKPKQAAGQQEIKQAGKAKELGSKYIEKA